MSKSNSGLFYYTGGYRASESRLIPGTPGVVQGGKSSALGKNMFKSMGVKGKHSWNGYQAQHIIPSEMAKHPVLQKIGMNLDDASNGIFLRTPGKSISAQTRHRGYHKPYSDFVREKLDHIDINDSYHSIQKQVYDLQRKLRKLQQSGLPIYQSSGATVELWRKHYNKL